MCCEEADQERSEHPQPSHKTVLWYTELCWKELQHSRKIQSHLSRGGLIPLKQFLSQTATEKAWKPEAGSLGLLRWIADFPHYLLSPADRGSAASSQSPLLRQKASAWWHMAAPLTEDLWAWFQHAITLDYQNGTYRCPVKMFYQGKCFSNGAVCCWIEFKNHFDFYFHKECRCETLDVMS